MILFSFSDSEFKRIQISQTRSLENCKGCSIRVDSVVALLNKTFQRSPVELRDFSSVVVTIGYLFRIVFK